MTLRARLAGRGLDWIVPDWPAPPSVQAVFVTRNGGHSAGPYATMNLGGTVGDDPQAYARNVALLAEVAGTPPLWLSQTHGTNVARVDGYAGVVEADAAVATLPGRAATIRVADCLPVLFCDRDGTCVGAAHAGWRGLCAGVLEATVAALPAAPGRLIAWMGPAIGPQAFEVGDDVRDAFMGCDPAAAAAFVPYPGRAGKWLADLYALARQRMAGVGVGAVYGGGYCTYTEVDRFFSYRREKSSGRMAGMVWLGEPAN